MRGGQRRRQRSGDVVPALAIERPVIAEHLGQRRPFDVLGDDHQHVAEFLERVDGDDVGVPQLRRGACLALQAGPGARVARRRRRQDLQRHAPAEARVDADVEDAHAAACQQALDAIGTERRAGLVGVPAGLVEQVSRLDVRRRVRETRPRGQRRAGPGPLAHHGIVAAVARRRMPHARASGSARASPNSAVTRCHCAGVTQSLARLESSTQPGAGQRPVALGRGRRDIEFRRPPPRS